MTCTSQERHLRMTPETGFRPVRTCPHAQASCRKQLRLARSRRNADSHAPRDASTEHTADSTSPHPPR
jgi:hypothetical protein